jgi:hypothetical protein
MGTDPNSASSTFTLKGESAGSTSLNITSGDSRISSLNQTVNVVDPENGDLTLTAPHNIAQSSASAQNAVLITAQFKDANGNDLGVNNENITFTRASGTAAELDPNSDNTLKTDGDGNVSIYVNATDTTATTTFDAFSENYSNPVSQPAVPPSSRSATDTTVRADHRRNRRTGILSRQRRSLATTASAASDDPGLGVPSG